MRCLICGVGMKIRTGPYGDFYYCPQGSHGTLSVTKYRAILAAHTSNEMARSTVPEDPLMLAVERQTLTLGGGIMTDVERFYIDNLEYDPENFWQDSRPY